MTVYAGRISHKPSADHLAGELRQVIGATDNSLLAQAFGISGTAGSVSNNGKISLIDLFPNGNSNIIYADPTELDRIDDIAFIQQHLSIVVNWQAMVRYMDAYHPGELRLALTDISISENIDNLTNAAQVIVAKYFFGQVSREEVKRVLNVQDENTRFKDTIGRNVLGKYKDFDFSLHGLEFKFEVKTTHFNLQQRQVSINFKINQANIAGSARQIKGQNAKKQAKQFKFFKRQLSNLNNNVTLSYAHRYDNQAMVTEIVDDLNDKVQDDLEQIKRQIKNYLSSLQPEDAGIDEFDNYNAATAVNRLWHELRFSLSEITTGNINMENVRQWYQKEITMVEFLQLNQQALVAKLQNALAKRYSSSNINYDAYINRALEYVMDDVRGVDLTTLVQIGHQVADKVIEEYANSFTEINDLDELMNIYHAPNRIHDQQIIEKISNGIIERVGQTAGENNPELKASVETFITQKLPVKVLERYQIFLQSNYILLGSDMDQNLVEKYLSERMDQIIDKCITKTQQMDKNIINDYLTNVINDLGTSIDSYFKANFDEELALDKVKQNILNNLMNTVPYLTLDQDYWENKLSSITSYDQIKMYQHADNLEQFVNQFAPDFEDELKQNTIIASQDVIDEFNNTREHFNQIIADNILNAKVHEELRSEVNELPVDMQNTIDMIRRELHAKLFYDLQSWVNNREFYPNDTTDSVLDAFAEQEKTTVKEVLEQFDWAKMRMVVIEERERMQEDLQAVKQRLMVMFSNYVHTGEGAEIITKGVHLEAQLADTISPLSAEEQSKLDFYVQQVEDQVQTKFSSDVCNDDDLNAILDGNISYEEYIEKYFTEMADWENIIERTVNIDELKQIVFNEIVNDLLDDTDQSLEKVQKCLRNNQWNSDNICKMSEVNYDDLVNILSNHETAMSNTTDNWRDILSVYHQYSLIIINGGEYPKTISDFMYLADGFFNKGDFIEDYYDEISDNAKDDYLDEKKDNSEIIDEFNNTEFKKWLMSKDVRQLAIYAGFNNPLIVSYDDVFQHYVND